MVHRVFLNMLTIQLSIWLYLMGYLYFSYSAPTKVFSSHNILSTFFFFFIKTPRLCLTQSLQLLFTVPRMLFPQIHAQLPASPFSFPSNLFSDIFLLVKLPDHIFLNSNHTQHSLSVFPVLFIPMHITCFFIHFSQMEPKFHVGRYLKHTSISYCKWCVHIMKR